MTAVAYDNDWNKIEDRCNYYGCESGSVSSGFLSIELEDSKPNAPTTISEFYYDTNIISPGVASVQFSETLNKQESNDFRERFLIGDVNEEKLKQYLIQVSRFDNIEGAEFSIENIDKPNENIILQIKFNHDFDPSRFEHSLFSNPYENIKYSIKYSQEATFISPKLDSKTKIGSSNLITWNFDKSPGDHEIQVLFSEPKTAYIVPNEDYTPPTLEWSAEANTNLINGQVFTPDQAASINPSAATDVYILGDYIDIPSEVDKTLESKGIKVHRILSDEEEVPSQLTMMLGTIPPKIILADSHDFEPAEEARDYAIDKDRPLLFV